MTWRSVPLLFFALASLGQSAKEVEPKPYDLREAYEVYATALSLNHSKGKLLIADTTVPFDQCLDSRSDKPADAAIEDYKEKNKARWRLQRNFELTRDYQLISSKEIKKLQQPDPKGGFFWYFARGVEIASFSAVGFSADKTIAFVEMDVVCGGVCGHGSPFLLQKRNGKWSKYSPSWDGNPDKFPVISTCSWYY